MGNDELVRTTIVSTRQLMARAREVGGSNLSKGCNLLMQRGIESLGGSPTLDLSDVEVAELLAHRLRERELSAPVSGSGAALLSNATPAKIDRLRLQGAGAIVTRSGLLVPGVTPEGADALLILDLDVGMLAITAAGGGAEVELGEILPALASLASLVTGTLTRAWQTVREGRQPSESPQGQRPDWGLVIWPCSERAGGNTRIEVGDTAIVVHSLQLVQLASELYGLLARRSAASLQDRAELEELLQRPAADAPAIALAWERTHGEG